MMWKVVVKKNVETLGGGPNWKIVTVYKDSWRIGYETI